MTKISITAEDHVFVLTGAGISAESGLPTFRASDGLWAGHSVEDVCTPEAWARNPSLVWEFYSARRKAGAEAQPVNVPYIGGQRDQWLDHCSAQRRSSILK